MNVSSVTNHFTTANKGFITTLGGSISAGAVTVPLTSVSGLTNGTTFTGIVEPGLANEQEFTGVVDTSGVQITGVVWTDGTNVDHAAGVTVVDYVSATGQNMLTKGLQVEHNQDGTHSDVTADSIVVTGDVTAANFIQSGGSGADGWTVGLPAVSSVTANGNRSYTLGMASDVSATLSEGMRLRTTRTVAGNGYMGGAFNGSSHYFTKTSPSGTLGTVTNNFTIEATVMPTSYAAGMICARADAAANNGIYLYMQASGVVNIGVRSAGSGNVREIPTVQALPLNKKTHVAVSWTGGTVVAYFDGIAVPVGAASTSGGAPTTAGTGGDFSIGRFGANATIYFPGYISNVAWYDAVLTAATIKQHATYKLTGAETNCIGAWSLDNTANDQSSAGNNLTATGGVGYTAQSPHGQLGNGVETTKAVGLVMAVDGTDVTVQVPEGCTIPTSGGVSAVAYSTQANPYGWVSDKGRWGVEALIRTDISVTNSVSGTWVAFPVSVTIPTGRWRYGMKGNFAQATTGAASIRSGWITLASSAPTNGTGGTIDGGNDWPIIRMLSGNAGIQTVHTYTESHRYISLASSTTYTTYGVSDNITATETTQIRAVQGAVRLYAEPSCL